MISLAARPRVFITSRRKSVRARAGVLPEMMSILNAYVCPAVKNCSGISVGSEERQIAILHQLQVIADHYNIVHSEAYVIRALLADNVDLAIDIARSTDLYHENLELIRRFIAMLPDIYAPPEL